MKCIARVFALIIALGLLSAPAWAQTQVGTVTGTVTDQNGGVLPGVTATLTGPRGSQTAVTDSHGVYKFIGVSPGTYNLAVTLSGFQTEEKKDLNVEVGGTTTVDFGLKVGGMAESIQVQGAPVDVKSTATNTTVSNMVLQETPLYSSTSTGLLNAAPGIDSSSAYGGTGSYSNALLLDGVDTRDPEGGSAWTFFNQNLIQEIQVGGLGAPAEYGGFTGAIINTVTKSGGNVFSGLFSARYTGSSLASSNINSSMLAQNPSLGSSAITKKLDDYTVQMGGPIKQNTAFFFLSVQRYSDKVDPVGPVANSTDVSPRFNYKVTLQPTHADTLNLGGQYDQYNVTGRVGYWPSSQATDQQTVTEDAPEWIWNEQWRHVFGSNSLLETKWTGYTGYYYLDPIDPAPFTYDGATGEYSGGGGGQYYADRNRNQVQVSMTHYAQAFGEHSLKFGAEIERSHVRSQYQPYGPAGFYIYAYNGVPQYKVSYSYDVQGDNHRISAYAEDQWSRDRVTLNIGLRMDHIRGYSPQLNKDVYTPGNAWGPRVGVTYDLNGSNTSVVKAFWGRYYEGTAASFYTAATPGIADRTQIPLNPDGTVAGPLQIVVPAQVYGITSNIQHPRTDEFNASYETQLMYGLRLTATGIYRTTANVINHVISDALFSSVNEVNPLTGQDFTAYKWANPAASNSSFTVMNVNGFQYMGTNGSVIGTADPSRTYKALMLVLTNGFKGNLGYQFSYVLSKAEGTSDNTGTGWLYGSTWISPDTALINSYGELTNSRRNEIKMYFTYLVPRVDLMLGGNYTGVSGRPYTPYEQFSQGALGLPVSAARQILLEPRGSEHMPFENQVDLRVEKAFQQAGHRLGIFVDFTNLFNSAAITGVQTRYPSTTISGTKVLYQAPTSIQGARQVTFGTHWTF